MNRHITALCVIAALGMAVMILAAAPGDNRPSQSIADYQLSRAAHGRFFE
jgi:hypothetical protein